MALCDLHLENEPNNESDRRGRKSRRDWLAHSASWMAGIGAMAVCSEYPSNLCAQDAARKDDSITSEPSSDSGNLSVVVGQDDAGRLVERIRGMLLGTLLGDAAGGPIEFQPLSEVFRLDQPTKDWQADEAIDGEQIKLARERFTLRSYQPLRPYPESYGQWSANAEPGTVTDDSRHKMVLMHLLRAATVAKKWKISDRSLAQAYLDWPGTSLSAVHGVNAELTKDWLAEIQFSARWLLGERDTSIALPCDRLWVSQATCCGQMTLPPLAAVFAGRPLDAYLCAYSIDFIDNAFARDMNSALVAGLSAALVIDPHDLTNADCWRRIIDAMSWTDPYRYGDVRWSQRSTDRWLGVARMIVKESQGCPRRVFDRLTEEFRYTTKWEAQVPFVVMFACLELCDYDPIASLQLTMEWGEDTDSYAQLLGAFVGALHGPQVFDSSMCAMVAKRLELDYGESLDEWIEVLLKCRELAS